MSVNPRPTLKFVETQLSETERTNSRTTTKSNDISKSRLYSVASSKT